MFKRRNKLYIYLGSIAVSISAMAVLFIFRVSLLGIEFYYIPTDSMVPTIQPGDIVVADVWLDDTRFKVGDVIVFSHPELQEMKIIKRVSSLENGNAVRVKGDNRKNSLDSRILGNIAKENIEAKATMLIRGFSIIKLK